LLMGIGGGFGVGGVRALWGGEFLYIFVAQLRRIGLELGVE
jgi:hypothetical protein